MKKITSKILSVNHQKIEEGLAFLGKQSIHDFDPPYVELPSDWRRINERRNFRR